MTFRRYEVGSKFKLSKDALDNYGEGYRDQVFTVRVVYTHKCTVAQMKSDPTGHPGFDPCSVGPLYGSELNFDLYGWEMTPAR